VHAALEVVLSLGDFKVYGIDTPCVVIGERAAEILRNEHQPETLSRSRSARVLNIWSVMKNSADSAQSHR
jgi:hypothetical protein